MNGTPRPRSGAFPSTPPSVRVGRDTPTRTPAKSPNVAALRDLPKAPPQSSSPGPLISTDIIDAPTQRWYAFAFYVLLLAYRFYDFYNLAVDEVESFSAFIKWVAIDGVFLFGLPVLQIPWLEWSTVTAVTLFLAHATLDFMLMFRIGLPIQSWLISFTAMIWDSELAIAEHKVKAGSILHNASLILGKQIINILPEGSALLNPNKESYCLSPSVHQLEIPIQINQTEPILIELMRLDLDTMHNETITISARETRNMMHKAKKAVKHVDPASPLVLRYSIKKTGIYLLQRVIDKSKLEVRPRSSSLAVVKCPQARVKPTGDHRCRKELSNVALEVQGTPPLRIKYRTTVNGTPREASEFQSLQPDDFNSPLTKLTSHALIRTGREDLTWARSHTLTVGLNETLTNSGMWTYSVEEVQDALGNIVSYLGREDDERPKNKVTGLQQSFSVHERPNVVMRECNPEKPLQVAKGQTARLPITFGSTGKGAISNAAHTVEYLFTPEAELLPNGDHSAAAELKKQSMRSTREEPLIQDPGLYTLKSVSSEYCEGEVLEPASCLLHNPPEPSLSLTTEDIVDKCAGNPIGLRVQVDLIGTPPFTIRYQQQRKGGSRVPVYKTVKTLRSQFDLTPSEAGHYIYVFDEIRDWVYEERPLDHSIKLEQDVKPAASAQFLETGERKQACIDDSVEFDVKLQGEGPWTLEYEIVHSGKRKKHTVNVEDEHYTIRTPKLSNGGEYTVALASITDRLGCKEYLKEEAKVNVRHERPKAYFGQIEGKQSIMTLENKVVELPIRYTGTGPWELQYENTETGERRQLRARKANDIVKVQKEGLYQLLSVRDSVCPGSVDEKAYQFEVVWIARPQLSIPEVPALKFEGGKYVKDAVCEGEQDSFDIHLRGQPPYEVSYKQHFKTKPHGKTVSVHPEKLKVTAGSTSVRAETSQAGYYEYEFHQLGDYNYDHDQKRFHPLAVHQTVYPRPEAKFSNPGRTYSYCSRDGEGEEVIPLTFTGVPPFIIDIEIKHHGTPKPETVTFKNIPSNTYDLRIPHRLLHLGHSNIAIRKVRDARGCSRKPPPSTPRVQVSVHDAPTAAALEDRTDFCVGERLSFALGGQVPFTVFYTFNGKDKKASNSGTTFRRLAETPGTFTITGLRDSASECLASTNITKSIHPIPSVRLSRGKVVEVDIHEGGETELFFEFEGTPPFEFTYTRSTNARKGKRSKVLEMKTELSWERSLRVRVAEEGTYEVVSIKDRWCSFAKPGEGPGAAGKGDRLLTY